MFTKALEWEQFWLDSAVGSQDSPSLVVSPGQCHRLLQPAAHHCRNLTPDISHGAQGGSITGRKQQAHEERRISIHNSVCGNVVDCRGHHRLLPGLEGPRLHLPSPVAGALFNLSPLATEKLWHPSLTQCLTECPAWAALPGSLPSTWFV